MELIEKTGKIYSRIVKKEVPLYLIKSSAFQLMAHITPEEEKAFVFSFFCSCPKSKQNFKLQISTKYAKQTYLFTSDSDWKRHQFFIENDISLSPISFLISLENPNIKDVELGIFFPQIERGKIASSPIGDDISLPIISNQKGAKGATRSADKLSLKYTSNSFSSTSMVVFFPEAEAHQLTDDDKTVFWRLKDTSKKFDIVFYISGEDGGRFCIRVSDESNLKVIRSRHIMGHQEYAFAATFENGSVTCYIDGYAVLEFEVAPDLDFDLIALNTDTDRGPGLILQKIAMYEVPLGFPHLVRLLHRISPMIMNPAFELISKNMRYAISGDSEEISYQAATSKTGFDAIIRGLRFSLPQVLQQYPPGSKFVEENIRDWVFALMNNPAANLSRESYSKTGRSDLVLTYTEDDKQRDNYHIEFKIWGRHGYKELPIQPIKYSNPNDIFSVVILIDRRKNPLQSDFEKIIASCQKYPCTGIFHTPVLEHGFNYFVSFHRSPNSSLLKMVLNIHLSIPD